MHARMAALGVATLACAVCWPGPGGVARADSAREIPQSERVEMDGTLSVLETIAERTTPSGQAAKKLLDVLKVHLALEESVILPPLALLPDLAAEDPKPDMRWAIELGERVKAEHDSLERSHQAIKQAALELQKAAAAENDHVTVGFTHDMIADNLGDQEIIEPAVIVIGDYLRSELPAK